MFTYHDPQRCTIHKDAEDNAQDANDSGTLLFGAAQADDEPADEHGSSDLAKSDERHLGLLLAWGVDDEDDDEDELDYNACPIDGEDEGAPWLHKGQSIAHPKQAILESAEVWKWGILLHIFLLNYRNQTWPATLTPAILFIIKRITTMTRPIFSL